jgi:hypothetical protein
VIAYLFQHSHRDCQVRRDGNNKSTLRVQHAVCQFLAFETAHWAENGRQMACFLRSEKVFGVFEGTKALR